MGLTVERIIDPTTSHVMQWLDSCVRECPVGTRDKRGDCPEYSAMDGAVRKCVMAKLLVLL